MAEPASRTCKHCRRPRGAPRGCPFLLHPISPAAPAPASHPITPSGGTRGHGVGVSLPASPQPPGCAGLSPSTQGGEEQPRDPWQGEPRASQSRILSPWAPSAPEHPPGMESGGSAGPAPPPPKPGALLGGASTVSKLSPPSPSTKPEARKDKNVVEVKSDKLAEEAGLLQGANGERGPAADQVGPGGPAGHGGVGQGWERSRGAQGVPEVTLLSSPSAPHPAWAP